MVLYSLQDIEDAQELQEVLQEVLLTRLAAAAAAAETEKLKNSRPVASKINVLPTFKQFIILLAISMVITPFLPYVIVFCIKSFMWSPWLLVTYAMLFQMALFGVVLHAVSRPEVLLFRTEPEIIF